MKRKILSTNNVSPNIVSPNIVSPNIVSNKQKTTLNPDYPCDTCGEPAMVVEMDRFFSCPECYLERLRDKLKVLDRAFNYH